MRLRDSLTMPPIGAGGDFEFGGTDRFTIQRKLGSGGMGVVYQAYDRERETAVALKALRYVGHKSLSRFQKEFRALAHLSHQNLVRMGELFCEGGQWFFTMELILGDSFLAHVRPAETAGFHEERLRVALRQLAQGIAALHAARIVHRDIKPSNILVTSPGRVVLLDFGLITSTALDDHESEPTPSSSVVGTAVYMAPEQVAAMGVGPEADWYSVGVVIYEALTGRLPFSGAPLEVLMNKQKYEPAPPRAVVPEVPTDLDALCVELLRRDPKARPPADQILRRLGADEAALAYLKSNTPPRPPFVGRKAELALLREALAESRRGHAVTVRVEGPSGIGKASLVRAFTEALEEEQRGAVTTYGRGLSQALLPYATLADVVAALAQRLERLDRAEAGLVLSPHASLLARLFPSLERALPLLRTPTSCPADPQVQRDLAWGALRELLSWQASLAPLVVCLLDFHWADKDSLALLRHILEPPEAPPLLLILTLDPSHGGASAQESLPPCRTHRITLGPLTETDTVGIVQALWPNAPECAIVARKSAGHPLFACQLALHAKESVSPSLENMLASRRAALGDAARQVLDVLAVAGVPLSRMIVLRAAALDRGAWASAVSALVEARWITTGQTPHGPLLEPPHHLICTALKEGLGKDTQRRILDRLADAFATMDLTAKAADRLLFPLDALGDGERAAERAVLLARRANLALAFHRSADLFAMALYFTPRDALHRRQIARSAAAALAYAGRGVEASAMYLLATEGATSAEALDLKRHAGETLLVSGHAAEALDIVREVLGSMGITLAITPRGAFWSLVLRRARARLRGLAFRRRDRSQVSAQTLARIDVCWSIGAGLATVDYIRGADVQTRHLVLALDAGEPYRVARALAAESAFTSVSGGKQSRRTARLVQSAQALAEEIGNPHALGVTAQAAALAAQMEGRWKAARELCEKAIVIFREDCGVVWELHLAQIFHTVALAHLGELAELSRLVPRYLAQALTQGNLYGATTMRTGLSVLAWLAKDDPEGARREAELATTTWPAQATLVHEFLDLQAQALIDLYLGDGERAHERLASRWASLEESVVLRIQQVRITAHHLSACAALAAAEKTHAGSAAHGHLLGLAATDAKKVEKEKMPWSDPLALLVRAGIDAQRGQRESALSRAGTAAVGFDAADMALFAAVARRRQGALLGGDKGGLLVAHADAWMNHQSVRNPARMADMLAPGFLRRA